MDFLVSDSDRGQFGMDDDISDFFNHDAFPHSDMAHNDYIHDDWFKNLFDDPVLNDKMITDAAPPRIQSEHSYSTVDGDGHIKMEDDLGNDFFANNGALDLSQKTMCNPIPTCPKIEPCLDITTRHIPQITIPKPTLTATKVHSTPTTIIITTPGDTTYTHARPAQTLIQRAHIKVEPIDTLDQVITESGLDSILPPTPPHSSSSCSDSDGSMSPHRSAPPSPLMSQFSPPLSRDSSTPYIQPVFTNPIPTSGVLILTEEERRTLVQEGYPIPNKLPLTKNEEKNLKKIRRKIKNKISAQESRRKKKEYLELLEKQVESYTHENSDLKRKVDSLEGNNKSLLGQLQKLQSIVGKYTSSNVATTPTGSILMVVVLCFAMFLGNMELSTFNIGYNVGSSPGIGYEGFARPNLIHPAPSIGPTGRKALVGNTYETPTMKSRMLLSLKDECTDDEAYGPRMPMLVPDMCGKTDQSPDQKPSQNTDGQTDENAPSLDVRPPLTKMAIEPVDSLPKTAPVYVNQDNETRETSLKYTDEIVAQALLHPDISTPAIQNLTVGHETA